jgi:hypothetical protein
MTTWQGFRHSEHGGITLVPVGANLDVFTARGWEPVDSPEGVDPTDQAALERSLLQQAEAERAEAVAEARQLTGKALDQAVRDAGISPSGLTADEKRARLAEAAEQEAGQPSAATDNDENEGV